MLANINLFSLVGILVINLYVGFWIEKRGALPSNDIGRIRLAHWLWTGNWFFWLLSWFVDPMQYPVPSVLAEDLGAFSLIAFAVAFSAGTDAIKRYAMPLLSFFVLDCCYLLTVNHLAHHHDVKEADIYSVLKAVGKAGPGLLSDLIHDHTILFGPSLCLAIVALGLVAWVLATRSPNFEASVLVGIVGVVYAIAQIYVYQNGLFVPFLKMGNGAKTFLVGWRWLLVIAYWLELPTAVEIPVVGARIWRVVSTATALISTIVEVLNYLRGNH